MPLYREVRCKKKIKFCQEEKSGTKTDGNRDRREKADAAIRANVLRFV